MGAIFSLTACGTSNQIAPTSTVIPTPTPRVTPLPTVAAPVSYGSADRPFEMLFVPPANTTNSGSTSDLVTFLQNQTNNTFKVDVANSYHDVLVALCGTVPTFGWLDGWTLLEAQAQGCGTPLLQIKQDTATGLQADLIISSNAGIDSPTTLRPRAKTRDFCRLDSQDPMSWVLPMITLRAPGFDPLTGFRSVRDYPDVNSLLQDVANNKCVAAIASGTLTNYQVNNVSDITRVIKVIATSPELPFGGLVASSSISQQLDDQLAKAITDHPEQVTAWLNGGTVSPASSRNFVNTLATFQGLGINVEPLGQ